MRRAELARHLIEASTDGERKKLIGDNVRLADERLARELQKICYATWTNDPVKAQRAASAILILSKNAENVEIDGVAAWVVGIAAITRGRFEYAADSLENASKTLSAIGRDDDAAQADVARLLALAMLGRYDEAIATGKRALKTFVATGDDLAAGKIEMNLSNIAARRGEHRESEKYCAAALKHFNKASAKSWQAMAENGLANSYAELNEFSRAEQYYESALATAKAEKMHVTVAEIEASLGNLALLRGRFTDALRRLESSRQRYADLEMPHQSAIADLEIADIYADLNLLAEASLIYKRVSGKFRDLKMRAEEARSRLNHGRTEAKAGNGRIAVEQFRAALKLFGKENNIPAQVATILSQATLTIKTGRTRQTAELIEKAGELAKRDDNPRHAAELALLSGSHYFQAKDIEKAKYELDLSVRLAKRHEQIDTLGSATNLLGEIAASEGDTRAARRFFTKAADIVDELRSGFTADEFSMSFLASRHAPVDSLARLLLHEGKTAAAFEAVERGRSRALLDAMNSRRATSSVSDRLQEKTRELRNRLNSHYKQLERAASDEIDEIKASISATETQLADVSRQSASLAETNSSNAKTNRFRLRDLQPLLGETTTLIEFVENDGRFGAFLVTGRKIRFVADLADPNDILNLLESLHFQFGALRYGGVAERFAAMLKGRTDAVLKTFYDRLLRPLESHLSGEKLVIVPAGPLNYVPFHALHDGGGYVLERFEVGYAPSSAVWAKLQSKRPKNLKNPLLVGYADERIPLVEKEIAKIARVLPSARVLRGKRATFDAFINNASAPQILHLACHGQFRPDNPMFSSLHLADGWVTVRDICAQRLNAEIVTLSACETGLSHIFAGDEILGLSRGFLTAGAASIIVSLWTVNDQATARIMSALYTNLQRGAPIAASLRQAQLDLVRRNEHPYLWSPFVLIGR